MTIASDLIDHSPTVVFSGSRSISVSGLSFETELIDDSRPCGSLLVWKLLLAGQTARWENRILGLKAEGVSHFTVSIDGHTFAAKIGNSLHVPPADTPTVLVRTQ